MHASRASASGTRGCSAQGWCLHTSSASLSAVCAIVLRVPRPSNSRGVAAAGGDSGHARQARFLGTQLRGGMLDSIEAELALRAAALASGTLPSAV